MVEGILSNASVHLRENPISRKDAEDGEKKIPGNEGFLQIVGRTGRHPSPTPEHEDQIEGDKVKTDGPVVHEPPLDVFGPFPCQLPFEDVEVRQVIPFEGDPTLLEVFVNLCQLFVPRPIEGRVVRLGIRRKIVEHAGIEGSASAGLAWRIISPPSLMMQLRGEPVAREACASNPPCHCSGLGLTPFLL